VAAPTPQAVGAVSQSTGALSVAWPTHLTDDIGVLFVETANQAVAAPGGWTLIAEPGTGTAGTAGATRLSAFWKRAASAAEANVTVADTGARQTAFIQTFRGCIASGSPIDVSANTTAASSASVSIPGGTTTVNEALVVAAMSNPQAIAAATVRPASLTNASLTSLIERVNTQEPGVGGGGGVTNALPVGVFSYSNVGNGPGNDASGEKWRVLYTAPSPANIRQLIEDADAEGVLLVLAMAGNKPSWKNASNQYDEGKYAAQLDRFRHPDEFPGTSVDATTADLITDAFARRRAVIYMVDEPNRESDGIISPAQVASQAALCKARWSDSIVIARVTPTLLASGWAGFNAPSNGYPKLDYGWSQYNNTHGKLGTQPAVLWAEERTAAATLNIGLCISLNLWAGGIAVNTHSVPACWDYANTGLTSGYVKGDREGVAQTDIVQCGNLGTPIPSLICSPAWIEEFVDRAILDGGFPFVLMWNHATGTTSSEFNGYYTRSDFVTAFDNAIAAGQAVSAASWRTPK
jgi:hypothetical protein